MAAEQGNGWPPLEELHSGEALLIRRALDSLGGQQLEILGSLESFNHKIEGVESRINETAIQLRAEQRTEFRGVRQQLVTVGKTVEGLVQQVTTVGESASRASKMVDTMHKMLKELQVSDRFVSAPPPPLSAETPSIPPPLTLGDHVDWKRTPMGGIKLDMKDQAMLAQRMAKLEEERRVADAIAADRAATIAAQKKEAEEKRLADEKKVEADRQAEERRVELDLKKSAERRARLTAYVAAGVTLGGMIGGAIVWLVRVLTHH